MVKEILWQALKDSIFICTKENFIKGSLGIFGIVIGLLGLLGIVVSIVHAILTNWLFIFIIIPCIFLLILGFNICVNLDKHRLKN